MKKAMVFAVVATMAALTVSAATTGRGMSGARTGATTTKKGPVGADGGEAVAKGRAAQVVISQEARLGNMCLQSAPSLPGSGMGQVFKKPRKWIVLEMKYDTYAQWQDQLTVTWHVLLDITKATEKKEKLAPGQKPPAQYSYYTTSVTYVNIPQGSHAASVCLPPSVLERYGEPVVIAAMITNKEGDILATQNQGAAQLKLGDNWWENDKVLSAVNKQGEPLIERRQGLLDRSKTIFALVNPNDYEVVQ